MKQVVSHRLVRLYITKIQVKMSPTSVVLISLLSVIFIKSYFIFVIHFISVCVCVCVCVFMITQFHAMHILYVLCFFDEFQDI